MGVKQTDFTRSDDDRCCPQRLSGVVGTRSLGYSEQTDDWQWVDLQAQRKSEQKKTLHSNQTVALNNCHKALNKK